MKEWWQGLAARERRLVVIAAALGVIALVWMLIGKPLLNQYKLMQQDLQIAQETSTKMQQARQEVLQLRGMAANSSAGGRSENLHAAVIRELKQFQLDGEGVSSEEKDKDNVSLKLEGAPFDPLAQFLSRIETRYGARAVSLSLKPGKESGLVDAQVSLQR